MNPAPLLKMCSRLAMAAALGFSSLVHAQSLPPTVLEIDVENLTFYHDDQSDRSKQATNAAATPAAPARNFGRSIGIADIVAVNGQPARGTMFRVAELVRMDPIPQAGRLVTETVRSGLNTDTFEFLNPDGSTIGTILVIGLGIGNTPAGGPLNALQGSNAVSGGSGAFFGVRGQGAMRGVVVPGRQASNTEDPVNRRQYGGGRATWLVHLIPNERPSINVTPNGPAIMHSSDFSLVNAARPAAPGEILSVFMTGLGPTKPGVDPGAPFPAEPPANVNSPIQVTVNGKAAEVIGAVGYPGTVGSYQLNFRVPPDATPGTAGLQVSSAWVPGREVAFTIR